MIKQIIKDQDFLKITSVLATIEDKQIAIDLVDTLNHHQDKCLGLAANMIGTHKNILAFYHNNKIMVMYNPVIIKKENSYNATESCLSLEGQRDTKRYQKIKVSYYNEDFQKRIMTFHGLSAQIIQHEMDHFQGIII